MEKQQPNKYLKLCTEDLLSSGPWRTGEETTAMEFLQAQDETRMEYSQEDSSIEDFLNPNYFKS
jgi:hypothetical protein